MPLLPTGAINPNSNLPTPNTHMEVLYRQTFNTLGGITAAGLTQINTLGNDQKKNNTRWNTPYGAGPNTTINKGILGGSVVAVVGNGLIGPCAGDSTVFDAAVGIAVNDAVGNPFESSSAVASQKVVYCHGTGTVFDTDIYETKGTDGTAVIQYNPGDLLYASQNGLLTNSQGLVRTPTAAYTVIGIVLQAPTVSTPYMYVQMKI